MKKILYIKASPREEHSHSVQVATAFLEQYKKTHPGDEIITRDVFKPDLPVFEGSVIDVKYAIMHGLKVTPEQKAVWTSVENIIAEFKSADKIVMAVPMWNFNIPYRLKQYIDVLVQPTYTFTYDPNKGYQGLVTGKKVFVAYARGGEYPTNTPYESYDMQKKYLELIFGFIGVTDIISVIVEPTLQGGPDVANEKTKIAVAKAKDLAINF